MPKGDRNAEMVRVVVTWKHAYDNGESYEAAVGYFNNGIPGREDDFGKPASEMGLKELKVGPYTTRVRQARAELGSDKVPAAPRGGKRANLDYDEINKQLEELLND